MYPQPPPTPIIQQVLAIAHMNSSSHTGGEKRASLALHAPVLKVTPSGEPRTDLGHWHFSGLPPPSGAPRLLGSPPCPEENAAFTIKCLVRSIKYVHCTNHHAVKLMQKPANCRHGIITIRKGIYHIYIYIYRYRYNVI